MATRCRYLAIVAVVLIPTAHGVAWANPTAGVEDPVLEPDRPAPKAGEPLSNRALVTNPAALRGVQSWSLEARNHRGRYHAAALSPDGKLLATGGLDGTVRLWDLANGDLVRALLGHDSYVHGLAFSPGGRYLASAGTFDRTARIWEVETGKPVRILREHPEQLSQVAWTRDGKWLVGAGGRSGDVSVWQLATGQKRAKFALGTTVLAIAVHPDSIRLAAVTAESRIQVLDLTSEKTLGSLGEVGHTYLCLEWSPSGKQLAAGTAKGTWIYDPSTGKAVHQLEAPAQALVWSREGDRLATTSTADRLIRVWSMDDARLLHKHAIYATWLQLIPGNTQLAAGDLQSLGVINLSDGKHTLRREIAGTAAPFWTSGRPVLTGIGTASVSLWDPANGKLLQRLAGHKAAITAFAWSPDGKSLATAAHDRTVLLWDVGSGAPRHTLGKHTEPVLCLAWSPDGKELASGGRDRTVLVWNVAAGVVSQSLAGQRDEVACLTWSPSGNTLAAGMRDGTIQFYSRADGKLIKSLPAQLAGLNTLVWSADARSVAGGDQRGEVVVWSYATGKPTAVLPRSGSPPYISSLAFYPLGDILAAGRGNHTLDVWSMTTQKKLHLLPTMAPVEQVIWATPGPWLAVTSADRTCRFFDPASGKLNGVVLAEPEQLVAVSADGHYRADGSALERLAFVVQTEKGQEMYTPAAFAARFGRKNDPARTRLPGK